MVVKVLKFLLCLSFYAALQQNIFGQIVNISNPSIEVDSVGFQGNFDLFFYNSHNSINVVSLKGASAIQYLSKSGNHRFLSVNGISQMIMKSDGTTSSDDRGVQHFRYNYVMSKKWELEVFCQAQFNEPLRIGFRGLAGPGVRYVAHKNENQFVYYGLAVMYNYERELGTSREWHEGRLNLYGAINRHFGEKTVGSLYVYYQPVVTTFSDFRVSATCSFEVFATDVLGFKVGLNLQHDSTPIEDPEINEFTYTLVSGLTFKF